MPRHQRKRIGARVVASRRLVCLVKLGISGYTWSTMRDWECIKLVHLLVGMLFPETNRPFYLFREIHNWRAYCVTFGLLAGPLVCDGLNTCLLGSFMACLCETWGPVQTVSSQGHKVPPCALMLRFQLNFPKVRGPFEEVSHGSRSTFLGFQKHKTK